MKDLFALSIIQGVTEFLPVSSTAHLQLAHTLFHLPSFGRLTEVALHLGTLLVPLVYFHRDIFSMVSGLFSIIKGRATHGFSLFLYLVLATLPVVAAGYMLHTYVPDLGRTMMVIGWSSIISGVLLYVVDENVMATRKLSMMTLKDALVIGLLQVIALIPGVSRLGITLIAGRLLGFKRTESARFSFLLSIPAVLGATTLTFLKLPNGSDLFYSSSLFLAMVTSFGVGFLVLAFLMIWLRRFSFAPIALYRIALGFFLLWYF
jgi:undecaprenyl-diphosphatase